MSDKNTTKPIRTPDCPECYGGEGNGHPLRMVPRGTDGQNYELICDTQGESGPCGFSVIVLANEDEQTAVDRQYASIQKIRRLAAGRPTTNVQQRLAAEAGALTEEPASPWTDPDTGMPMDAGDIRADIGGKIVWLAKATGLSLSALMLDLTRDARAIAEAEREAE